MKPSLEKLYKFFALEAERGYDNHAVVGGIPRILDTWENEARVEGIPENLIQAIGMRLRDYPRLSQTSRAETLDGLWKRIQRETGTSLQIDKTEKKPAPKSFPQSPKRKKETRKPPDKAIEHSNKPTTLPVEDFHPLAVNYQEDVSAQRIPTFNSSPAQSKSTIESPAPLDAPVQVLPGIGKSYAQTLGEKLGLHTLRDMLYNFPRRHIDYATLKPINRLDYGEEVTVIATVKWVTSRKVRAGSMDIVEALVSDGTGDLRLSWFNQPWRVREVREGAQVSISGKTDMYLGKLVMSSPEVEAIEQHNLSTNRIVPIYGLSGNLKQKWMRKQMNEVVTYWAPRVLDHVPYSIRKSGSLIDLSTAILQAHFPDTQDHLAQAHHRLAFDEIFLIQLGILRQKRYWQGRAAHILPVPVNWRGTMESLLPYSLTNAQQRAITDIQQDLVAGRPMNRLLQGDVGSGKTVIAALAIGMVAHNHAQSALMAPTSILATQHYKSIQRLLNREQAVENVPADSNFLSPSDIRLLIGATSEAEKAEIRQKLADGSIKLIIGTHALIEDTVSFADLQLIIVDEQHRFGVEQRAALRAKGTNPHLLAMTATPIPRSLQLTIFGDLDVSILDEMPPGRQDVDTFIVSPRERERAYQLIRTQVSLGRQVFIIYPLIEESERSEASAATTEFTRLQAEVFPQFRLGLLHGKMAPDEKDSNMEKFYAGETQILVSTTVIEVGVDIPNATIMLVESANRFGLAQLHQLRGRVGRGEGKSYCLLIPETTDALENERLQVMTQTNDGFLLAEKDLEQRGPGEFLGTRQSGYAELKLANLVDLPLIDKARRLASSIFEKDPDLVTDEYKMLKIAVELFWAGKGEIS